MIVQPGFLAALSSAFTQVPRLFCATAQIFFPPGVRREETGKAMWHRLNALDFPVRCDDPIPGEDLTWVLYGSGGCSLLDTAKLRRLGGVSEIFVPAYVEDLDLGYRAWKQGWPSVFCSSAQVEHRHRATTSRFYSPRQLDAFVETNYLRFLTHAVGSPALFRRLWSDATRRLQLLAAAGNEAALDVLRTIPRLTGLQSAPAGDFTEEEILALNSGDVAVFPGKLSQTRPAILIASPYLPYPLSHGGAVRIFNLMRHAAQEWNQILIAFCDELETPPRELLDLCSAVVLVRRRGSHYRKDTPLPDVVEEFDVPAFHAALRQSVARWEPAIVQLEFTQMARYSADCHPAATVLVEHDITFDLQQQLLEITGSTGLPRWELEQQLAKWRAFETQAWNNVNCVVTMSQQDASRATPAHRVTTLPNGVDTIRYKPSDIEPEPHRLLFVGSFNHLPNLLALEFFLRDVWPRLGPAFTLHVIAGARHEYFRDFHQTRVTIDWSEPRLHVEGFVADVRPAYTAAELILAPLTASAGTNIKVLEAMAMGKVVVGTRAGFNGLDVTPGLDTILAASPAEMARQIEDLSGNPAARKRIEHNARETALRYSWKQIAESQSVWYRSLIGKESTISG